MISLTNDYGVIVIIVSASDNNFVPGLFTLIYSAWIHNRTAKFYVIDAGIDLENLERLLRFCKDNSIFCEIRRAEEALISDLPTRGKLTTAAYARILIPDLFPDESRAIYLDADTVVVSDLRDLWATELGDKLVAGVVDGFVEQEELDAVGLSVGEYINSGVLVMNLDAWRRENIADQIFKEARRSENSRYLDQTALNSVARGRIHFLEREWNFFSEKYVFTRWKIPRIIHFAGSEKPWRFKHAPFAAIYNSYRLVSRSNIQPPTIGRRFSVIRRMVLGLIGLRRKYWNVALAWMYYRLLFTRPHTRKLRQQARGPHSA